MRLVPPRLSGNAWRSHVPDTGTLATFSSCVGALRECWRFEPCDNPRELLVAARGEDINGLAVVKCDQWTVEPHRYVLLIERSG
jgi:hypothetical protein